MPLKSRATSSRGGARHEQELFDDARLQTLLRGLSTPLKLIIGYAEVLQSSNPRPEQEAAIEQVMLACRALSTRFDSIATAQRNHSQAMSAEASILAEESPGGRFTGYAETETSALAAQEHALASAVEPEGDSALWTLVETQRRALLDLRRVADTDFLTGIGNRRAFERSLDTEWQRAQRYGRDLALFMVDIDGLKAINDGRGHSSGDAVIAEVARRLGASIRSDDAVCRVGGDEFVIVVPETDAASARIIARKLATVVAATPIDSPSGPVDVHLSVGWASSSMACSSASALVAAADARLYRIKARRARSNRTLVGVPHHPLRPKRPLRQVR